MSSSIKLTNSSGKIVTITNPDTTSADVAVDLLNNAYTIATVDDFGTVPVGYTTVIVKDTDRGGVFNRIASTTANGGTIFDGTTGYSWERQYSGAVNVKWFGAKGDGVTDDTVAINYVFANFDSILIPYATYNVTSVKVNTTYNYIQSDDAIFYGIATLAEDAILVFEDARETILRGRLRIQTDGNATTPVYHDNYSCGVLIKSTGTSGDNSQFMYLQGIRCSNIKAGIVSGGLFGEPAQSYLAQSEIWIEDYQCRGVLQPFYSNAINGYITLSNCLLVGNKFEASSSWWDYADGWCIRADEGAVNVVGTELQRSTGVGYAIYGKGIFISNGIHEYSCPNYITGTVTLTDISNGYFGQAGKVWMYVDAAAEGALNLSNVVVRRPAGVSSTDSTNMIECAPNDFRINITNSLFTEWRYTLNGANSHFIKGGRVQITASKIESAQGDFFLDNYKPNGLLLSCDGTDMVTTQNQTNKSGWVMTGTPASGSWFAQSPDTYDGKNAIRIYSPATSIRIQTPFIDVGGIENIIIDMLAKSVSTGTGYLRIYVNYYDSADNYVAQSTPFNFDFNRFAYNGYQDALLPLRVFQTKNKAATRIKIEFYLSTMTFDFTDFKVILN